MDEVHELEDAMQMSVDTAASSPKKRSMNGEFSSQESEDGESSSDDDGFDDRPRTHSGGFGFGSRDREDESSDDSDEPPEIPGSPIAQKLLAGAVTAADFGGVPSNSRYSTDRSTMNAAVNFGEDDEYEAKEVEQSRTAEFHASSSSEDEESDDDFRKSTHDRSNVQLRLEKSAFGRPKTAAKDLEKYRNVVPNDFFEQFKGATTVVDANSLPSIITSTSSSQAGNSSKRSARTTNGRRDQTQQRNYKVEVPREMEELFSLVDAYMPEDVEIGTRLEPFLPEFTPSVGLPFDGILIPRPDGKEDKMGVEVLREPSGQTNVAELELLLQVSMTHQNKLRSRGVVVRSIERASHRPHEIDQWIASVDKVQRAKPLAQVNYKQPGPPLSRLMELWSEEFENFLAVPGAMIPTLSELDVNLKELVKIVCVMLDIPVYEGNYVQSLHVLFSLYLEIEAYEQDARYQQGLQR